MEGVPSAFSAARDGMDAVLRDRGLRRSTPDDTARSLLLAAWANANLEGSPVSVEDLESGTSEAVAMAAVRLSSELLGLLPVWDRAPLQAMARIHALAAAGSVPAAELGRPINPEGVRRLTDLARMLAQPTRAPALVVGALVHAEIADAGAFVSHNGTVGRSAERLVWLSSGLDPASVTVPEAGHALDAAGYVEALSGYGSDGGVHRWLLYAAEAATRAVEASPLNR